MQRAIKRSFVVAATLWSCLFIGAAQACTAPNCTNAAAAEQAQIGKPLMLTSAKRRPHRVKKATRQRQTKRISAKSVARSTTKPATKTASREPTKADPAIATAKTTANTTGPESVRRSAAPALLAPDIADARAELTQDDTPLPDFAASRHKADHTIKIPSSGVQISSADQFNAIDRAMVADTPAPASAAPTPAPVMPIQTAAAPDGQPGFEQSVSGSDGAWDQASLVGKIFIALGAMLTLASAARMLIV